MYSISDLYKDVLFCNSGENLSNQMFYGCFFSDQLSFSRFVNKSSVNENARLLLLPATITHYADLSKTPYTLHKSYPSARSFYTMNIFYSISTSELITPDIYSDDFLVFKSNKIQLKINTLYIVKTSEVENNNYSSIHNSLQILEAGHIIGSYLRMQALGILNILDIQTKNGYIELGVSICSKLDKTSLNIIEHEFDNRSSGDYYGILANYSGKTKKFSSLSTEMVDEISHLLNINNTLAINTFLNDGFNYISDQKNINYSFIQKEYPFWDVSSGQAITIISIKLDSINENNVLPTILMAGIINQLLILKNSATGNINRPVKQVIPNKWESIICEVNNRKDMLPFYGLISLFD